MSGKMDLKPKEIVYLDSGIPSFYYDERPDFQLYRKITRGWWTKRRDDFYICSSVVAQYELESGNYGHKKEAIKFITKIALLPINDQVIEIAAYYIEHYLAPKEDIKLLKGDALHLAVCSFYKVDYLLTWNQKHLANVNKLRQFKIMNGKLDLETPLIITPEQLML